MIMEAVLLAVASACLLIGIFISCRDRTINQDEDVMIIE